MVNLRQIDYVNQMITLSVITLSGLHSTKATHGILQLNSQNYCGTSFKVKKVS
jgi:hypothetical protein